MKKKKKKKKYAQFTWKSTISFMYFNWNQSLGLLHLQSLQAIIDLNLSGSGISEKPTFVISLDET